MTTVSSLGGTYGLSGSGLDIDSIVKKLMSAEQTKEDKLVQNKTVLQWQKSAYNTVYDDINNFRNTVFNYKLQKTLEPNKVTSSNTSVATATANAGSSDINHSLVVAQLADGVKMTSSASLSVAGTTVDRSSIASQFYSNTTAPTNMNITMSNGSARTTFTVDPNGSIYDLVNQINNAGINVSASYDSSLDRFFLTTTNTGASADISFAGSNAEGMSFLTDKLKLSAPEIASGSSISSSGSVQSTAIINPAATLANQFLNIKDSTLKLTNSVTGATDSISIKSTDTLQDVMDKINAGNTAVARFDSTTGQFSLTPTAVINQLAGGKDMTSTSTISTTGSVVDRTSIATQFYQGTAVKNIPEMTIKIGDGSTSAAITVNPNGSLSDFADQINSSGLNVTASYDSTLDKFTIKNNDTNAQTNISFSGSNAAGTSFLHDMLKLPANDGKLSVDGSDQGAMNLLDQLHMPAAFKNGTVTSTSSVVIPLNSDAALQSQFSEFEAYSSTDTFTLKIADGTDTPTSVVINPTTDSLQGMLDKINAVSGVDASYDSGTGKITLKSTDGKDLNFSGSDAEGTSFLANTLKMHQAGQDAVFKLDGTQLKEDSNTFTIAGITYGLTGVSDKAEMLSSGDMDTNVGQATNISVSNDIDTAVSNIQSLVDSYNKILNELNSKVDETRYTDYPPLTDDQKSAMKDSDITLWNQKAQSGMLHSDPTLISLINSMRNAFSSPVSGISGKYNSAASIGITTGDYTEGGKLHLDTDKLKTALQANPNILNQIFASTGTTTTSSDGRTTTDTKTQGIAGRLYDTIKNAMDKLNTIASTTSNANYDTDSNLAKEITAYTKQISTEEDRFKTIQAAYYKQYNAMEEALSALNNQSSWISSMLGTSG
jgi:Flagellar capping protein